MDKSYGIFADILIKAFPEEAKTLVKKHTVVDVEYSTTENEFVSSEAQYNELKSILEEIDREMITAFGLSKSGLKGI